jgi:hypothetical protein
MSDHSRDDSSSATAIKRNHRNRNEKIQAIATKSAEKDGIIKALETKSAEKDEIIKRLEVENGVLKSKLAEAQQTICTLASGQHLRPAFAGAPSSPQSPPERSVVAVSAPGLNVAARAWHQPHHNRPSVSDRLGDYSAGQPAARGRGSHSGYSSPSSQERRTGSGRGQGSSSSEAEPAPQDRSARPPHGRGHPRCGAQRR